MNFIRDLYVFIDVTILLLFVLQRVDTKCEKDINNVKKIFNTAVDQQSLQRVSKSRHMEYQELRGILSNIPNTLGTPGSEPYESMSSGSKSPGSQLFTFLPLTSFIPPEKFDAMYDTFPDVSKNEISLQKVLGKRKIEETFPYFDVASPKKDFSLCSHLATSCFEDVSEVEMPKKFTVRTATINEYKEINNEDQELQKKIADLTLIPCSFTNTSGKTINFFYSIITKEEKPCVVLFKRSDNKLMFENVELYAIIDDEAVLESINIDTSTEEEHFF